MERRLWEVFAYAARYGRQPLSELKAMTIEDLGRFTDEVSKIVEAEKRASHVED
jgi:hypothetical protein